MCKWLALNYKIIEWLYSDINDEELIIPERNEKKSNNYQFICDIQTYKTNWKISKKWMYFRKFFYFWSLFNRNTYNCDNYLTYIVLFEKISCEFSLSSIFFFRRKWISIIIKMQNTFKNKKYF